MVWLKEIKSVGFLNWWWFVVVLKRNEFSRKLDVLNYYPDLQDMVEDRRLAHYIDKTISEVRFPN